MKLMMVLVMILGKSLSNLKVFFPELKMASRLLGF